jgi:D-glycero-alpha-D-manno-heptose-7-phosphate kinase
MSKRLPQPLRIINSVAPIRICDNGGWTDTWFAGTGSVFNIGVYPYTEVQLELFPRDVLPDRVVIHAENYGERYAPQLGNDSWDRHPLLEAAIVRMGVPDDIAIRVNIHSEAPVGASTGTSAAVSVALIGALDRLTPGRLSIHEVAYLAQSLETDMLGQQSGIQDQLCAAYGGINYIEMFDYPHCTVSQIQVTNAIWWELEQRLLLIYLGNSHDSSQVHEMVIHSLEAAGPSAAALEPLRRTAIPSRDAVYAGNFAALGQAMIANTEGQRALHPALVSPDCDHIIDVAQSFGALGWKVNGAGGDGGSITILCGALSHQKRALIAAIEAENPLFQHIPTYLSRVGLRIWES